MRSVLLIVREGRGGLAVVRFRMAAAGAGRPERLQVTAYGPDVAFEPRVRSSAVMASALATLSFQRWLTRSL